MEAWVGFDLDGTTAVHGEWKGPLHIGAPIAKTIKRIKGYLRRGIKVKIFTARVCPVPGEERNIEAIIKVIQDWCEEHIGVRLEVTCMKDYGMLRLYDDRCVRMKFNTGEPCCDDHLDDVVFK